MADVSHAGLWWADLTPFGEAPSDNFAKWFNGSDGDIELADRGPWAPSGMSRERFDGRLAAFTGGMDEYVGENASVAERFEPERGGVWYSGFTCAYWVSGTVRG